jgi:hypothetical protein
MICQILLTSCGGNQISWDPKKVTDPSDPKFTVPLRLGITEEIGAM